MKNLCLFLVLLVGLNMQVTAGVVSLDLTAGETCWFRLQSPVETHSSQ